jgi:hypothetical protein
MPPPVWQRGQPAAPLPQLPPLPAGLQGANQLQAIAAALNVQPHRPILPVNPPPVHVPVGVEEVACLQALAAALRVPMRARARCLQTHLYL